MKAMEKKILEEGKVLPGGILKVGVLPEPADRYRAFLGRDGQGICPALCRLPGSPRF